MILYYCVVYDQTGLLQMLETMIIIWLIMIGVILQLWLELTLVLIVIICVLINFVWISMFDVFFRFSIYSMIGLLCILLYLSISHSILSYLIYYLSYILYSIHSILYSTHSLYCLYSCIIHMYYHTIIILYNYLQQCWP